MWVSRQLQLLYFNVISLIGQTLSKQNNNFVPNSVLSNLKSHVKFTVNKIWFEVFQQLKLIRFYLEPCKS